MKRGPMPTFEVRRRAVDAVLLNGEQAPDVAETFGLGVSTVYRWVKKYSQHEDPEVLRHKKGAGPPQKLGPIEECELIWFVLQPAGEYGFETDLWTAQRLRVVVQKNFKKRISEDTVLRILRKWGFTYQKPEKRYVQANDEAKRQWIRSTWPEIREFARRHRAILYFEDECNISLSAVLGKTWAPGGKTPVIKMTGTRASVSAISAISNSGRLVFTLHENTIRSEQIIAFLKQLLLHHPHRHIVVVMDQAKPHVSKLTRQFIDSQSRLHVFYLPPYSPEFNPDEKVWNHLKNIELKAHRARNKTELKTLSLRKMRSIARDPGKVKAIFQRSELARITR